MTSTVLGDPHLSRPAEDAGTSQPSSRHRPSFKNLATEADQTELTPFAEGAFRNVYRGKYTEGLQAGDPCVMKMFKKGSVYEDRFFAEDVKAVGRAKEITTAFNAAAFVNKTIYVNEANVWHRTKPDADGRHERMLVEPMIEGEYVKFNSNSGYVNGADVMQALSHFSYDYSQGQELLCDLQGGRYDTCYVLTDPVVMSRTGVYGATDLGANGISNFFFHHKCNQFCKPHWRKVQAAQSHFNRVPGTTMSMAGPGAGGPVGSMGTLGLAGPSQPNQWLPPVPRFL